MFHCGFGFWKKRGLLKETGGEGGGKPGNTNHDVLIIKMVVKKQKVFYLTFQLFCGWQCYSFVSPKFLMRSKKLETFGVRCGNLFYLSFIFC